MGALDVQLSGRKMWCGARELSVEWPAGTRHLECMAAVLVGLHVLGSCWCKIKRRTGGILDSLCASLPQTGTSGT